MPYEEYKIDNALVAMGKGKQNMPYEEYKIDNALVAMKDRILRIVSSAYDQSPRDAADTLMGILCVLSHNKELWAVLGYEYKRPEIAEAVRKVVAHWQLTLSKRQWQLKNLFNEIDRWAVLITANKDLIAFTREERKTA